MPKFSGDAEYESWWMEINASLATYDLSEADKIKLVNFSLTGEVFKMKSLRILVRV